MLFHPHASKLCTHAQVFYHLGELDDAVTYALGAGSHFDVDEQSEYVQTLVGEWPVCVACVCVRARVCTVYVCMCVRTCVCMECVWSVCVCGMRECVCVCGVVGGVVGWGWGARVAG